MAKYSSTVRYHLTTTLDRQGLVSLQTELNKIQMQMESLVSQQLIPVRQANQAVAQAQRIQRALQNAFSQNGSLSTSAMFRELTANGRSLSTIYQNLGSQGNAAFLQMYTQMSKLQVQTKNTAKWTEKLMTTFGNTVRWGITASIFQEMLNSIHSAVDYMGELDASLTNIRLVTTESKESMREFAKYANQAAQVLGSTTVDYTDAALIYAQQGYNLSDQKVLADYTIKTANATEQDTAEVSEQMTSLINGFHLSVDEVGTALDSMAKVANTSAADLEELATATAKVASTANTLGVTQDQLTAQIATIVSVTREAPENIGNSLKTIYARFGDLSLGETLDDGTDLGKVSSTLEKIGVQVLDDSGAMRDMGTIIEDLMGVWGGLDTATKQATAVTIAGKYQYNRLMALMENTDMYEEYYEDAITSEGTLDTMQSKYMESLEGKAQALEAAFEGMMTSLFDQDDFGVVLEELTKLINGFTEFTEVIGGSTAALQALGSIGLTVLSSQIGTSLSNVIGNRTAAAAQRDNLRNRASVAQEILASDASYLTGNARIDEIITSNERINSLAGIMTNEQIQQANNIFDSRSNSAISLAGATQTRDEYDLLLRTVASYLETQTGDTFLDREQTSGAGILGMFENYRSQGIDAFEDVHDAFIQYREGFQQINRDVVELANAVNSGDISRIGQGSSTLIQSLEGNGQMFQDFGLFDSYNNALESSRNIQTGIFTDEDVQNVVHFNTELNNVYRSLAHLDEGVDVCTQSFQQAEVQVRTYESELEQTNREAAALQAQLEQALSIQTLTSFIGGITAAVQGVQALNRAFEDFNDTSLTAEERLTSLVSNGLMGITMLGTAADSLISVATKIGPLISSRGGILTVLRTLGSVLARFAGWAAPIALVGVAVYGLYTKFTKLEQAAKNANDQLEETKDKAQTLKEELESAEETLSTLKSELSDYNESRAALSELEQGTEEWNEALKEANDYVLSLLENYPELAQYISRDKNGALNLTQEGQDYLIGLKEKEYNQAVYNSSLGQVQVQRQAQDTALAQLQIHATYTTSGIDKSSLFAGDKNGFFEDLLSDYVSKGIQTFDAANLEKLVEGRSALISDSEAADIVEDLSKNATIIAGYLEDYINAQKTEEIMNESLVDALLNLSDDFDSSNISDYPELLSQLTQKAQKIIDEGLANDTYAAEYNKLDELSQEELAQKFADYKGIDVSDIEIKKDSFKYDGETYERADVLSALAEQSVFNVVVENWEELASLLSSLDNADSEFSKLVGSDNASDALLHWEPDSEVDTSNWTEAQKTTIRDKINEGYNFTEDDLFGNMSSDERQAFAEEKGAENPASLAQSFTNQLKEGLTDYITAQEQAKSITSRMRDDNNTYASEGQKETYRKTIKNGADIDLGRESNILSNLDAGEEYEKLAESYGDCTDALQKYRKVLDQYNKDAKNGINSTEKLESASAELADAVKTAEWKRAAEELQDYTDILQNGDEESVEYQQAIRDIAAQLSELSNLEISDEWVQQNKDAVNDWLNGVEGSGAKLYTLMGFGHVSEAAQTAFADVGANYSNLQNAIASNKIVFNAEGQADFAQFTSACQELDGITGDTTNKLQILAAYLDAMGGGQLIIEHDGDVEEIAAPKISEDMTTTEITDAINQWVGDLAEKLNNGWSISSIDIPVSDYTIPTSNSTPGNTGSGSSGSGGGGGSSYTPKTKDKTDSDLDRYQDVNAHLDRLSNTLETIADEQDRLNGKARLDNMREQIRLLEKQIEQEQRKLEIQQQEAAELRDTLSGYGIRFDADNYIINYASIYNSLWNQLNNLIDQYNAATDEATQDSLADQIEEVEDKLDDFTESIERYDELINNDILDTINNVESLADSIEDLRIEAFEAAIEASESIQDINDAWADFMGFVGGYKPDAPFRALTEDVLKLGNAMEKVNDNQLNLDTLLQWVAQYKEGGVISEDNPFGENSAAFYENLEDLYTTSIDDLIEAEQNYYQIMEDIIDGYEDIADRIDKRMEQYSNILEQIEHYSTIVETLYGSEDYEQLLQLKRANQEMLESSVNQAQINLIFWQNELAKYNKETQPEIWEEVHDQVVAAQEDLNSLVEDAANNTAEILQMAIEKTVSEWKDLMLGGDADWMETQWSLIKQNTEQYLDSVEEAYEIEKLRSKYNSLANDTMDLNLRKRINEQMREELEYLNEKDKLSEYDVQYANAKLEILQKQIALEETLANKNQMKLRRDSQGNYSYVYAADRDDVEDARNDLLDSEYNAYEMSKENYLTNYDNYIAAISAAAEQIKAINANTLLSEEEKSERTQFIYDNLSEYLGGIAEQIGVSEQNMLESVKYLAMDSSEIVGQNYADIAEMMEESWTDALAYIGVAVSEEFDNVIHHIDDFLNETQEKWDEFEEHTEEWANNVQGIADNGCDAFYDIEDVIIDLSSDMADLNDETQKFYDIIKDDLGLLDQEVAQIQDYQDQIAGLKETTSQAYAALAQTKQELLDSKEEAKKWEQAYQDAINASNNSSSGSNSGGSGSGGSGGRTVGSVVGFKGQYYYDSWGKTPSGSKYAGQSGAVVIDRYSATKYGGQATRTGDYDVHISPVGGGDLGWVKASQLFNTGGYTGEWSDGNPDFQNGKLAWLHQKELILNAKDTENILSAVSLVRELVETMKLESLQSISTNMNNIRNISAPDTSVAQNIEIYADFPAAESAAEIKAALNGLVQEANQYAYRRK